MRVNEIVNITRNNQHNDIILYLLLGCLVILCISKYLFAKNIDLLGNRTGYISSPATNGTLFLIITRILMLFLSSMIFVSFYDSYSTVLNYDYLDRLSITFFILMTILLVKQFITILFFRSFYDSNRVIYILKNASFINARNVIVLLICCFFFYYSTIPKEYTILSLLLILAIIKVWEIYINYNDQNKGSTENKNLWYYKILYLCTLEILPILILVKLLMISKLIQYEI